MHTFPCAAQAVSADSRPASESSDERTRIVVAARPASDCDPTRGVSGQAAGALDAKPVALARPASHAPRSW